MRHIGSVADLDYPAATNLITNGGFETDVSNWVSFGSGATVTRVTSQQQFGSAALAVVTTSGAAATGASYGSSVTPTVTAGNAYTFSMYARGVGTIKAFVDWYAAGVVFVSTSNFVVLTLASGWARYVLTATAPATAVSFRLRVPTDIAQSITFDLDGVQCELGSTATPYIETDGGTATRSASNAQRGLNTVALALR